MRYTTHRISVSPQAGDSLFGRRPPKPTTLIYYGLDFSRFLNRKPVEEAKRDLGIAPERKVIGHVGRLVPVKNHGFLIDSFEQVLQSGIDAHLLLVGDGPQRQSIEEQIRARGLAGRCTFAGAQSNVVPFFSAMDVFVLPSLWEGFSLVTLEAQAAGVPVVASAVTPQEVAAIPALVKRIPLSLGVSGWASAIRHALDLPAPASGDEALRLQNSQFGLPVCIEALSKIYLGNN
jgi:glycosyltransferase involved in cell wall biosynthesis